jgi:hypothetical protein
MGYLGTWILVQYLEGRDVSEGGMSLSTGEHVITRDNVDAPSTIELFDREMQANRVIETPAFSRDRQGAPHGE